jgi:hypothetical protein
MRNEWRWWFGAIVVLWLWQMGLTWSYRELLLSCLGASK